MHILLIRFSSMGDVVLQTATVNWLRSLFGRELRLTFVTAKEFSSLISTHPEINEVITYDRRGGEEWKAFIGKIDEVNRQHPIDLILDLHATLRSWRLKASFWTTPALTVDKRRWERFLLTKIKSVPLRRIFNHKLFGLEPQVERIIRDFETIFSSMNGKSRTQSFRKGPHEELTSLGPLDEFVLPAPYIVLAPAASFAPKRWHADQFVELANRLLEKTTSHVVILAGPADDFCSVFDKIKEERLHNLQGKTSLKESMAILQKSSLCIGNDSGMNHIAEAYGVPCVTIFGPTHPAFGFAPHGKRSTYLSKDLWCKPCSTTGKKPCYRERHFCMEDISVDEVLIASLQALDPKHV